MRRSAWLLLVLAACPKQTAAPLAPRDEATAFLAAYEAKYQPLYTASQEAEWLANTHIVEGDSSAEDAATAASEAMAAFTGSVENIETSKRLLAAKDQLDPLQVKQLEAVLFAAADNPATIPDVVSQRIAAEQRQTTLLYGYAFTVDGKEVTPNAIDEELQSSDDLVERRKYWEASKAIGPTLKPGLAELRDLRNHTVQALGYPDYYTYQVSDYDMSVAEMDDMMLRLQRELRPLYRELHTWARYTLAEKYHQPVPDQLPADWLPNRWGQDWSALVTVEGADVDTAVKDKSPEWIVKDAEDMYVSLGFEPLPPSFWEKSSLYPVPEGAGYKKNTHASAWHMDLDHDVRSLMSVEPNAEWYETTHHELGHIYYYLSYSRPGVPLLLREGANRAFHEAVGSQMGMAAMQRPFLQHRGLIPADAKVDEMQLLLKEALAQVVFIPFACGTMPQFERSLYVEDLPTDRFNQQWWADVLKYQGIVPPTPRGEEWADGLTKTHINDDPASYYDYALSSFLLFQLHDHIAKEILHEDPRATDYYGHKEVGDYLKSILAEGDTGDWRALTREKTGSDLSAKAMVEYFQPLQDWLHEQNKGRTYTLPEL
jgi:peptidyl-dipeptidase A